MANINTKGMTDEELLMVAMETSKLVQKASDEMNRALDKHETLLAEIRERKLSMELLRRIRNGRL